MRICYQAIEGFRSKTLRVWREDKPEAVTVTTQTEGYSTLITDHGKGFVSHDTPREAGEWVGHWLRTYDS